MKNLKVSDSDKEQRLRTAALLLDQVRRQGGTAKELAAYLKTSPTTISHWQSQDDARRRRVAAPSEIQLKRLVGYLSYLIKKNLYALQDLASGYRLRSSERLLFQTVMGDTFMEHAQWWTEEQGNSRKGLEDLVIMIRDLYQTKGAAGVPIEMLRSLYNLSGLPEPENLESGAIDFDRLCTPSTWNKKFVETMMLDVEGFMIAQAERKAGEEGQQCEPEDHQPENLEG